MADVNEKDVRNILEASAAKAEALLGDPNKVDALLAEVKTSVSDLPQAAVGALQNIPLMASMIKGYVTQQYTNVSPKVVASVLGSLLYLVKGKDLIPDSIPVLGLVDDVAVEISSNGKTISPRLLKRVPLKRKLRRHSFIKGRLLDGLFHMPKLLFSNPLVFGSKNKNKKARKHKEHYA